MLNVINETKLVYKEICSDYFIVLIVFQGFTALLKTLKIYQETTLNKLEAFNDFK